MKTKYEITLADNIAPQAQARAETLLPILQTGLLDGYLASPSEATHAKALGAVAHHMCSRNADTTPDAVGTVLDLCGAGNTSAFGKLLWGDNAGRKGAFVGLPERTARGNAGGVDLSAFV